MPKPLQAWINRVVPFFGGLLMLQHDDLYSKTGDFTFLSNYCWRMQQAQK